eukprot:COSAG02_NODE_30325_length_553_cov_1.026432_1_plen_112_part_10
MDVAEYAATVLAEDKAALLAFKAAGALEDRISGLSSWVETVGPCDGESYWNSFSAGWRGVKCDGEGGRVTAISGSSWGDFLWLRGTLQSLGRLTALRSLYMYNCYRVSGDLG